MILSTQRRLRASSLLRVLALGSVPALLGACGSSAGGAQGPAAQRAVGQHDFLSAPLPSNGGGFGKNAGANDSAGATPAPAAPAGGSHSAQGQQQPQVQETDLYRLDGDRLYYLNAYRGLMVFDVSNVDQPKLLGRSPIFGDPVEMFVQNGFAVVVVGDWYGRSDDGTPFHGSIVRGIDATDPANIRISGEAKLAGWVRDTRVVGDVLYTVSEDMGWQYMWYDDGPVGGVASGVALPGGGSSTSKSIISSVSFANGQVALKGSISFDGYNGVFNVTPSSILVAHSDPIPAGTQQPPPAQTGLEYIDISDRTGIIKARGSIKVSGLMSGWGADNGRWNLDFADGTFAHAIGCSGQYYYCSGNGNYVVSTVDFTNADAPTLASELSIPSTSWSPVARFDSNRMYLSPAGNYSPTGGTTPLQIYDLTDPKAPKLAGTSQLTGNVWLFIPDQGVRLFALGNDYSQTSSQITLRYFDVTDATAPKVLGTASFGDGWAWTPAAGTFKAFTKDANKHLVVLPFSGWDNKSASYNDGVQLIQYGDTGLTTAGAAKTHGWVERGIFVKNRLVSLSDLALSVIDYTDVNHPQIVSEMTLARNVVNARPQGQTIAEVSSDWWGNDLSYSEVRVLPIANAEETTDTSSEPTPAKVDGVNATVFQNGNLTYVVTSVSHQVPCPTSSTGTIGAPEPAPDPSGKGGTTTPTCTAWTQQVQIVDTSSGAPVLRGKVQLPDNPGYYYSGWGWYGCWYWDWFDGSDVVQVGNDALAFRRWTPNYVYGANGLTYSDATNALYVVDLSNADAPSVASTTITHDPTAWWGNMRAVGNTLYTTHYDWIVKADPTHPGQTREYVKYYLDRIDLTDRAHPAVGSRINVPGVLVGASKSDPSLLYTIDYRWDSDNPRNDFAVVKVDGDLAYLQSITSLDGWVGNVVVQNDKAYMSAEIYDWVTTHAGTTTETTRRALHQLDLSNPQQPIDRKSTDQKGWGWLLGVQGDRALVTSGWGTDGLDIYKLSDTDAPQFDQFVRTRGWWTSSLARQDNAIFVSSGYWGVQRIDLQ